MKTQKRRFRFLMVDGDKLHIVMQDASMCKIIATLPNQHRVYHQGVARANGCTIIVRAKAQP